jgi:protein TonB
MVKRRNESGVRRWIRPVWTLAGAVALTLAFFLVLPLMQTIGKSLSSDLEMQSVDTVAPPPPQKIAEEEPEKKPEEPETPPQLAEPKPLASLAELEMALSPGFGAGVGGGELRIDLATATTAAGGGEELFRMADLDQKPRIIHQPSPQLTPQMRKRTPGTVYVIFIVDEKGRVVQPKVQRSSDPIFDRPSLAAVKRWKFEPGKRAGKPVRFRMRVPISFPKTQ